MHIAVLLRVDQAIHHLGQFLSRHAEFARGAAAADGEQYAACFVFAFAGTDDEAVFARRHVLHALVIVDLDAGFFDDAQPPFQQFFLAHFPEMHLADDGQFDRRGHGDLVARILENRAAERDFLLHDQVAQLVLDGAQCSTQSGRAGADNDHVIIVRTALELGDRIHRLRALAGGFADQAHTAQFARNEDAFHIGLESRIDLRDVHAAFLGAENQCDGILRAGGGARAVADAVSRIDQHRLALDHAQRLFRASLDATARAETAHRIDYRVQ